MSFLKFLVWLDAIIHFKWIIAWSSVSLYGWADPPWRPELNPPTSFFFRVTETQITSMYKITGVIRILLGFHCICIQLTFSFSSEIQLSSLNIHLSAANCRIIFIDFCLAYCVCHDNSSWNHTILNLNTVIILCLIKAAKETGTLWFLDINQDRTDRLAVVFLCMIYEGDGELIPVICGGNRAMWLIACKCINTVVIHHSHLHQPKQPENASI